MPSFLRDVSSLPMPPAPGPVAHGEISVTPQKLSTNLFAGLKKHHRRYRVCMKFREFGYQNDEEQDAGF